MKTGPLQLSGPLICSLMRKHRVRIADIATKFNLTKKRVREAVCKA